MRHEADKDTGYKNTYEDKSQYATLMFTQIHHSSSANAESASAASIITPMTMIRMTVNFITIVVPFCYRNVTVTLLLFHDVTKP